MGRTQTWAGLPQRAKTVFTTLWRMSGGIEEGEHGPVLHCCAKIRTVAAKDGCHEGTVKRALDILRDAGLLTTINTGRCLLFTLFLAPELREPEAQSPPPPVPETPDCLPAPQPLEEQNHNTRSSAGAPANNHDQFAQDHNNTQPLPEPAIESTPPPRSPEVVVVVEKMLIAAGVPHRIAHDHARTSNRCQDPGYVKFLVTHTRTDPRCKWPVGFLISRTKHDAELWHGYTAKRARVHLPEGTW